jgi:hypothetical protein
MEQLDFTKVLKEVDDGYRTWRKPSLLLFGANDPFIDVKNPFAFLESKRTSMRLVTATAKVLNSWQVSQLFEEVQWHSFSRCVVLDAYGAMLLLLLASS